ncbi:MAG: 30S ribosomal protein S9 [Prevotellaceae bacterium]|jgi:small subunit ribosomal protein S9|nr:30S ribosomal protein S9 [Prevotellaceae bacterium]
MEVINALGRRKSAIARIYVNTGKGAIVINNRPLEAYFPMDIMQYIVKQPLELTGTTADFDIKVNLDGGGTKGQAEALRLAIARALCKIDRDTYRPVLKANGLLTRDPREVERKKPGQPGARKRFQFSKR